MTVVMVIGALDIGGTGAKAALFDLAGKLLVRYEVETGSLTGDPANACAGLLKKLCATGDYELTAAGVSVPCVVNNGCTVEQPPNLSSRWKNYDLRGGLSELLGVPVVVGNDCADQAEVEALELASKYGFDLTKGVFYLGLGTGAGGATVELANGQLVVRPREPGHIMLDRYSGLICGCGVVGHFEAHVGGACIQQRFGAPAEELSEAQWGEVLHDLGLGLATIASLFPGYAFVLGGGIGYHRRGDLGKLAEVMEVCLMPSIPVPLLLPAAYGLDSGIQGAAHAAKKLLLVGA